MIAPQSVQNLAIGVGTPHAGHIIIIIAETCVVPCAGGVYELRFSRMSGTTGTFTVDEIGPSLGGRSAGRTTACMTTVPLVAGGMVGLRWPGSSAMTP
jgi:hypothetical protein